eukprot:UN27553
MYNQNKVKKKIRMKTALCFISVLLNIYLGVILLNSGTSQEVQRLRTSQEVQEEVSFEPRNDIAMLVNVGEKCVDRGMYPIVDNDTCLRAAESLGLKYQNVKNMCLSEWFTAVPSIWMYICKR